MELNLAVIREILLYVRRNAGLKSPVRTDSIQLEGYDDDMVSYHGHVLCLDDCFVVHVYPQPIGINTTGNTKWPNCVIYGLTIKGHERLAFLEKQDLFEYVKGKAKEQGSGFVFTFGRELASSWLKKQLGLQDE